MMYAHLPPDFDLSSAAPTPPPLPPPFFLLHEGEADDAIYDHLGNMGKTSLIPEYDLGGEGDLFKAPEPIIEEPMLTLDPVTAAISMMSCSENAMDDTINVSNMGLSEVLYECEKEIMEKSATEDMISELQDAIPMLQVEKVPGELRASPLAGECSLQKSVSSGCLNSADWMNGSVRPNFLDFQGLDFKAAFGLRMKWPDAPQDHGEHQLCPPPGAWCSPCHHLPDDLHCRPPADRHHWRKRIASLPRFCPRPDFSDERALPEENLGANTPQLVTISDLKTEERKQKLSRYRMKKIKRNFGRKIKYTCRKALADSQPRMRGRFAKMHHGDMLKPRK